MRATSTKSLITVALGVVLGACCVGAALASLTDPVLVISQKGKRFGPQDVALRSGERIAIVNDDGIWTHHAYIDAPDLKYDSGDIEPGDRAVIDFPRVGDFTVLCGIHPNMRLGVHVR